MSRYILAIFLVCFFFSNYTMEHLKEIKVEKKEYEDTPLHWLVDEENIEQLKSCLNKMSEKGSLNKFYYPRGKKLQTPLHRAVVKNNLSIVEILFKYPISIDAQDEGGSTPLMYSIEQKDCKVLKYLLKEQRANVGLYNKINWSAAHTAVYFKNYKALKLLRKYGASLNIKLDNEIITPLDLSAILFKNDDFRKLEERNIVNYLKKNEDKKLKKRKKMKIAGSSSSDSIDADYEPVWSRKPDPKIKNSDFEDRDEVILNRTKSVMIIKRTSNIARKKSDPPIYLMKQK